MKMLDARFGVLSTMDGQVVIDNATGRPLTSPMAYDMAVLEATTLNEAAVAGPRALAKALGAVEYDD